MRWLALACACLLACGDNLKATIGGAASNDAPPGDAATPDARPLGGIDAFCQGQPGRPRVLVYTFENVWRHLSNYYARLAIYNMCTTRGFTVTTTNDPLAINATRLADVDVVVFSITSGNGIDAQGQADLEAFIRGGGGLVGLHSASYTEWDDPFYLSNIGAMFKGHNPGMQPATVDILSTSHPITQGLGTSFSWTDEWYFFENRPEDNAGMDMLLALDESTLPADYPSQYKVGYHPIAWAHELYGGRVFYTALGHNPDAFSDPTILEIIGRAIEWTAHQR